MKDDCGTPALANLISAAEATEIAPFDLRRWTIIPFLAITTAAGLIIA